MALTMSMRMNLGMSAALVVALGSVGCSGEGEPSSDDAADEAGSEGTDEGELQATYTYWRDAKSVLDRKCVGCHEPGGIGPFALSSYAEVEAVAAILPSSIEGGTMPPWPPSAECNSYRHDRSLDEREQEILLTWLAEGAPEGDMADEPEPEPEPEPVVFEPDLTLALPEPYTPTAEPDDYRCFVIPWDQSGYVTGVRVDPDQRSIVHHVIAFVAEPNIADMVDGKDAAEPGPGYTCFGDAGVPSRWVGSWVPGGEGVLFPEGTGVRVDAGSRLIVQVHYNTSSAGPIADQSSIAFMLTDQVERPLVNQPVTNPAWPSGLASMLIPAGESEVSHSAEIPADGPLWLAQIAETGIQPGEDVLVHAAALHMHTLGLRARLSILRGSGDEACVVEIPDWDFSWQGNYALNEPLRLGPDDTLQLQCWWDNSAGNQPIIDGERAEPIDVDWGEGTRDEMCLGVLMLSRP